MAVNLFKPSVSAPYGFSGAAPYNISDVPARWASNSALSPEQLTQKLAYEWMNSHEIDGDQSNPPFTTGSAGRINPTLPGSQKILRGYIRRANYEAADPTSKNRLYFMFNPENITRDYVSYLDQAALDPFNTVYGSGNLVAPPSFMNFRFDLFFDRQDEVAQDIDNPGVFADYQFFDLVVRNVIPTDPNQVNNSLPDNGVMMVNPRDITVVFSPQITVQGRPINAQVVFEKFSHRMTPIRMRIALEMRVVYIGPMRPMTEYTMETYTGNTTDTVNPDDTTAPTITYADLLYSTGSNAGAQGYVPGANTTVSSDLTHMADLSTSSNGAVRRSALDWAVAHVKDGYTQYDGGKVGSGVDPSGFIKYTTCSGLVWNAYNGISMTSQMGWGGSIHAPADTIMMVNSLSKGRTQTLFKWSGASGKATATTFFNDPNNRAKLERGDLLLKDRYLTSDPFDVGHVAFFMGWSADGSSMQIFDAASKTSHPQVGERTYSRPHFIDKFTHVLRPIPLSSTSITNSTNPNSHLGTSHVS